MIFLLEKKMWDSDKESVVRSEIGEALLRLEPMKKAFSKKIQVYDRYHVPIGIIEKKVFKSGLYFDIIYDERVIATFSRTWSLFSKRYSLKAKGGPKFRIKGDFKNFNYKIVSGRSTYAKAFLDKNISSEKFSFETKKKEYRYIMICAAVILAMIS